MTNQWQKLRVEEFAEVIGGGTPKTSVEEYWNGQIPWLTPKDLSDSHDRFISNGERFISTEGLKNSSAKLLPKNTVLLSSRAPVGYVAIAKKPIATNQGFRNLILHNGYNPEFVYYLLKNNTQYLESNASGTTFRELSGSTLKSLEFNIPPLATQERIADILGTLDDKIALNRRMNHTLEAMARAIFKSWFVDFDPVHAKMEGRDYPLPAEVLDLFPNELVESELGLIPKGWEVGRVGDIAVNGTDVVHPDEVDEKTFYIGLEHMPRRDIALDSWDYSEKVTSNKYAFRQGSILFGKLRPYFHKVGIAPVDGICSTDILVINGKKEIYQNFLLFLLSSKVFVDNVSAASTGTKMPRTNWNYMESYEIPVPSQYILDEFNAIVTPMIEKIILNIHASRNLVSLRDVLLPKLMIGEIGI